jgi:hypothetical protein
MSRAPLFGETRRPSQGLPPPGAISAGQRRDDAGSRTQPKQRLVAAGAGRSAQRGEQPTTDSRTAAWRQKEQRRRATTRARRLLLPDNRDHELLGRRRGCSDLAGVACAHRRRRRRRRRSNLFRQERSCLLSGARRRQGRGSSPTRSREGGRGLGDESDGGRRTDRGRAQHGTLRLTPLCPLDPRGVPPPSSAGLATIERSRDQRHSKCK